MPRVLEYRLIEDLDRYHLRWRHLLEQTRGRSFFQSLDWLHLYWRHFGQDQQLRVLVAESREEILGIVPLVERDERTRAGKVRVLTYPLHDWGSFYGPIGPNPTATLAACLSYLRDQPRTWDLLDLRWINKLELDQGRTPLALATAGFPHLEHVWRTTAILDFEGSWEEYLAGRSSKFRGNLRRAEAAAAQTGEMTFQRYRPTGTAYGDGEPRWDFFDECRDMAEQSWQASSATGTTICHSTVCGFFRDLFGLAAQAGSLDMNLLRCNGQLIAFSYNLITDGCLIGLRIGFDHHASALSPGRLLLARSISDSFRRGDRQIDLGSETMKFKRQWLTRTSDIFRYTHYSPFSVRSQLLRTKHWLAARRRRRERQG